MKNIVRILVMSAIGGVAGFSITRYFMDFLKPVLGQMHPLWLLLLLPGSVFLSILIHEAGHVAGGALNGFRFSFMSVFFLKLEKTNGRLTLAFNKMLASWGGLAVMIPSEAVTRKGYLWFVAGGPLGSLTGLVLSGAGLWAMYPHNPEAALFLAASVLINSMTFLITALPVKMDDNIDTDGIQFFDLLRGGDRAARKLAMARLLSAATSGIRPLEFPEELIQAVERPGEPDRDTLLAMLFRNAAQIDRKDWANASETMRLAVRYIDKLPPLTVRMVYLQAAIIGAFNRNALEARQMFEKAGTKGWADATCVALAEASVKRAEGKEEGMAALLEAAKDGLSKVADPGSRMLYESIMDDLRTPWTDAEGSQPAVS
jgi:hypothetical protein